MLNGYISQFAYAGQIDGEIQGSQFRLQGGGPHAHFSYLSLNIEEMLLTGVPQYPVERTLLTTGVLDAAMRSRHRGHIRLENATLGKSLLSFLRTVADSTGGTGTQRIDIRPLASRIRRRVKAGEICYPALRLPVNALKANTASTAPIISIKINTVPSKGFTPAAA